MKNQIKNSLQSKGNKWCVSLLLLFFTFILGGCGKKNHNPIAATPEPRMAQDYTDYIEKKADSLLNTLTLEQRVGQCLMPALPASESKNNVKLLQQYIHDYHVGGIVLMSGTVEAAKHLAQIGRETRVPLFIGIDAEWGLGMRLAEGSLYPKNGVIGKNAEETEIYDYGREIAGECRKDGINMVLGPVIDITPRQGGVMGKRSFGPIPERVANLGVAYAKGLESGGVISVAKHFPGHGNTSIDSHKGIANLRGDTLQIDTVELRPFKEYINQGLTGVMAGHIRAFSLDPQGAPASVSGNMLTSLLREKMGFQGLIITDAFSMGGAKGYSAAEALKAGADIVLGPENLHKEYQTILNLIKQGEFEESIINDHCRRILFIKYLFHIIKD